jgi:hypothetical protein
MKRFQWLGITLLMAHSLRAAGDGGAAGMFLTLPAGARSAALGEGGVALIDDASTLHLNPARMSKLNRASVVGTHGAYVDGSFADQIDYVAAKKKWGTWGVGFQYFSAGPVDQTDSAGTTLGSFTPNDQAVTAGYARPFGPVTAGLGAKYVRSTLIDSAQTLSMDLGVETKPLLENKLTLGFVGQNLFGSLKYDQENSDLPMMLKAAAAYGIKQNWDFVLDATFPKQEKNYFSIGTEYRLKLMNVSPATPKGKTHPPAKGKKKNSVSEASLLPPPNWGVALRGGYNTKTSEVDGFAGFSMGLGVRHKSLSVDYAFLPFGDIGNTHWITLGWRM